MLTVSATCAFSRRAALTSGFFGLDLFISLRLVRPGPLSQLVLYVSPEATGTSTASGRSN
jgi:hypothetical protein